MKKCKQGYYYCYKEKSVRRYGYHLGARGYLAKDNDNDNEGEDTTKNGNGNGNGNGGNGYGGGTVMKRDSVIGSESPSRKMVRKVGSTL